MFDSPRELLDKIELGEDSFLELKEVYFRGDRVDGPKRDQLADEIAAMANSEGGVILLGVDDKTRDITGIPREKLDLVEKFIFQILNESIEPPLFAILVRLRLPDGLGEKKAVLKIEVPRSLFVHKSPGGYYHRIGSSKREMTTELLTRHLQQRSQALLLRFEEQIVPGTTAEDLERKLWERYFGQYSEESSGALQKLKLLAVDREGLERATVAGILMATSHPERWIPNARIEAVRYRGVRQDSNYQVDAASITGPLDDQIRQAIAFVRRTMSVGATKNPGREDVWQFSVRAVFEAIVNAVAHRDYSIYGSKIRLFLFDDRLELYSPGALPNSVTVESLHMRQATRNELLTSILARCKVGEVEEHVGRQHFMEKRGDGVPVIYEQSIQLSGRRPEYRMIDNTELLLTIWSAQLPNRPPLPLAEEGAEA